MKRKKITKITNEQEYESAYHELSYLSCDDPISEQCGYYGEENTDEIIRLEEMIEEYELANGYYCPECKIPHIRGSSPGVCNTCSKEAAEDWAEDQVNKNK